MAKYFLVAVLCVVARAAPSAPTRLARLYQHAPEHLQTVHPINYFADNSEVANYYNNQAHQKQGNIANGAPSRLETLEPDSEVELIPGAQQPQQPPQQAPVAPNLPGLIPGQRVFIVHMPVAGYRPGTVGGYQPVYIVAAAPQGNTGYPANGYQNAIFLNPINQGYSPFLGYPGVGQIGQTVQGPAGLLVGGYNRPVDPYQEPAFAYQPNPQSGAAQDPVHLSQLVNLQAQAHPTNTGRNTGGQGAVATQDSKRVGHSSEENESVETKEPVTRQASSGRVPVSQRKV